LRRLERQPSRVKRAAEGRAHRSVAVPTGLDNRRFETGHVERDSQAVGRAARVEDEVRVARRAGGWGKRRAACAGDPCAMDVAIDQLDLTTRNPGGEPRYQTPHRAAADDGDAIAGLRLTIPEDVDRGFEVGRQHGTLWRHLRRQRMHGGRGYDVSIL